MRRLSWIVLAALPAVAAAAVAADSQFLVGGGDRVWLVVSEKGYHSLIHRDEKGWRRLPGELSGDVAAVAAADGDVEVFFADGDSVRYMGSGQQLLGRTPPGSLWPDDARLLGISAAGANAGVLALIDRPVQPEAATQPTTAMRPAAVATPEAPGRGRELALLKYAAGEWSQVAVAPETLAGRHKAGALAVVNGKTYALLEAPRRLLVWSDGQWRSVGIPKSLATGRVVAMFAAGNELVLGVFNTEGTGQLKLARLAGDTWQEPVTLRAADRKAVDWSVESPPVVAVLDEGKVGVAWRQDGRWQYAEFGALGTRAGPPVDILSKSEGAESALKLQQHILVGVFIAFGALMFWPGQPIRTQPFSLPQGMRVASLGRRAVAALIDFMPFSLLTYLLSGRPDPETLIKAMNDNTYSAAYTYAGIICLVAYVAYCVAMEHVFGATLGKRALRLRVVGDGGGKPAIREIALRNLTKIPEIMPPFIAVTWLFPLLTQYRQRIGDRFAWTAVIDAAYVPEPPPSTPEREETPDARDGHEGDDSAPGQTPADERESAPDNDRPGPEGS